MCVPGDAFTTMRPAYRLPSTQKRADLPDAARRLRIERYAWALLTDEGLLLVHGDDVIAAYRTPLAQLHSREVVPFAGLCVF